MSKDSRVVTLLNYGSEIRPRELLPTNERDAAAVVEENPFAFALAAVLDRGTKSEIIWTIPYNLQKKIGTLTPQFFAEKSLGELESLLRGLPNKPRYITDAPRTVKELSKIIVNEFDGHAERIWQNRTAAYVKATFRRIYGVGPGIASMTVLLLEKCFKIRFNDIDHQNMDVKPDVHVVRVFQRLRFISKPDSEEALKAARKLNPEYPGALDAPTWVIGKKWCTPFAPQCSSCPMYSVCPREHVDVANLANYRTCLAEWELDTSALRDAENTGPREGTKILRTATNATSGEKVKRDELGGFPYEVEKVDDLIIIRFYPRPTAKYPDQSVLTLKIDMKSKAKLLKILT